MASSMPRVGATASITGTSSGKGHAWTSRAPGNCRASASRKRVFPAPDGPFTSVMVPGFRESFSSSPIRLAGVERGSPKRSATSNSRADLAGRHAGISKAGTIVEASSRPAPAVAFFRDAPSRTASPSPAPDRPEDLPPGLPVRTFFFPSPCRPLAAASGCPCGAPPTAGDCRLRSRLFVPMYPAPTFDRQPPAPSRRPSIQLRPDT